MFVRSIPKNHRDLKNEYFFGNFKFDTKTYNNVEYINFDFFIEFVDKYTIDYLIVSRKATNLYYGYGVKNAYLWVHDVNLAEYDTGTFLINQAHKTKFKIHYIS